MTRPTVDHDPETRPRDASEVTFAFRAFGLNIGVELCAPVSSSQLIGSLPPGHEAIATGALDRVFRLEWRDVADAPIGQRGYYWFDEGEFRRFASTLEEAVEYAEAVIEHHVAEFSPDFIFVHAGVVTCGGRAIVLPGTSRAGKSTLVRALVNAGATYFTDEYAVLDADGIVYPYLRHLSQREGPFGRAGRVDLSAHAPSAGETRAGAPVALIVLTRFEDGADWYARRLGPGAAMMALSQHVIAIRRRPEVALPVMGRVVEGATVTEGVRGDATDAASRILAMLDADSVPGHPGSGSG